MDSPKTFPRLVKGALATLDSSFSTVTSIIPFQYNPVTLTRKLQVQTLSSEKKDRTEPLRLNGPPTETITLAAEFDATDSLAMAGKKAVNPLGIYPQLSALEILIYPTTDWVKQNMPQAELGIVEIVYPEVPMTLLVWGKTRVLPVRLTDFSITEEDYDVELNPVRAKVALTLQILNYNDLRWEKGGKQLFLPHHQQKEDIAQQGRSRDLSVLGIEGVRENNLNILL